MSRREKLESMLAEDPHDTFLRYALAMELKNDEEFADSERMFRELMRDQPPYVPAFFMLGQQLAGQDNVEDAKTVLQSGIAQARQQGDLHAAGEMTALFESL
jgi:predicted Zn-dependent protease